MKAILRINHRAYLFKTIEDATKTLNLLTKALPVCYGRNPKGDYEYIPDKDRGDDNYELELVADSKVNLKSLIPQKPIGPTKRTGRLLLTAPVDPEPLFRPNPYAPKE